MKKIYPKLILFLSFVFISLNLSSQKVWDIITYPDEAGFKLRVHPMLERIAGKDFGKRSLADSKCPDTGLPVKTWAVEGEEIISPYTGRKYKQGATGYFGPKSRNEKGQIDAFGGDPLKYDLPPAMASMLLGKRVSEAQAFLSIPGNLKQQYHFACNNWARFYPLLSEQMGREWQKEFDFYVEHYAESRRPSDGEREWLNLANPHNLVGEPGFLLGGNPIEGGTENHKTQWRTSCLLYSQILPDTSKISGYPVKEAEMLTKEMIRDYLKKLLITGNGEYDSQIYYPYTIEGFMNLYDFSPDQETKALAKFALDYYFVTYGLKVIDGTLAGAQKRGYLPGSQPDDMETMLWAFFNTGKRDMSKATARIHQVTTTYRPNEVIWNIMRKNIKLPFEARISRPFYHMDKPDVFAESFYCSGSYGIGNVQMTIVDNPNQQLVWSVIAQGINGPLSFSGGNPMRGSTSGHSPYTQTLQSKGSIIVMTAPTGKIANADTMPPPTPAGVNRANLWLLPANEQGKNYELNNRAKYGAKPLHPITLPLNESSEEIDRFWNESKNSASTWFIYPTKLTPVYMSGNAYFEAGKMLLAVIPLTGKITSVSPSDATALKNSEAKKFFSDFNILVLTGELSGYVVETAEKSKFGSLEAFDKYVKEKASLKFSPEKLQAKYSSISGDHLIMNYNARGLRCSAFINGKKQNFDNYAEGGVYHSPYLSIKKGIMKVSDGKSSYTVDFKGGVPVYY